MVNISDLSDALRVNGVNENSSRADVERVLAALNYTEVDKQDAISQLTFRGWFKENTPLSATATSVPAHDVSVTQAPPKAPLPPPTPNFSTVRPMTTMNSYQVPPQALVSRRPKVKIIVGVFVALLVSGGVVFAYLEQLGPFAGAVYREDNFFSGIISKVATIHSGTYGVLMSLDVGSRDKDAVPFSINNPNRAEMVQKYQDDYKRSQDVQAILLTLELTANKNRVYPATLQGIRAESSTNKYSSSYWTTALKDPSGAPYAYRVTEGGKNFELSVTFQTDDAISNIKKGFGSYNAYSSRGTYVTPQKKIPAMSGKTVTFSKDSYTYFYLSPKPPEPLFESLGEMLSFISPDIKGSLGITASSDWSSGKSVDWQFNIDGTGSFGDLTYKVNADALKKGDDYYVKINNIPSFFLGQIGAYKGKWIMVPGSIASSTAGGIDTGELSSITKALPEVEKSYKEERERTTALTLKMITVADQVKLVSFKSPPHRESVDGRMLSRYDLRVRKDALLPFYEKLIEEIDNDPVLAKSSLKSFMVDEGLKEYLQSDEFNQTFDYFDKNVSIAFWADNRGFPAQLEFKMRIVPRDSAIQLKDKQINISIKYTFSKINERVSIEVPTEFVSIKQLIDEMNKASGRGAGALASQKSSLAAIRLEAELVYDKSNSYGKNPFTLGSCQAKAGTLFADKDILANLNKATNNNIAAATCIAKGSVGKVTSYAISVPLSDTAGYSWCVDSGGSSRQIRGKLTSDSCN